MRLKARDHCIVRSFMVKKAEAIQVHFTLEGEGLRGPKKISTWMKNLHGFLQGRHQILFHGLLEIVSGPHHMRILANHVGGTPFG
jgi:hypothetical protein